jgi:hypothetical protein
VSIARRPYRRRATRAIPTRHPGAGQVSPGAFFVIAAAGWAVKKLRERAAANR